MTALPLDAARETRPPIGRLTRVELRKMLDTRAGFWLQAAVLAITVVVAVAQALVNHPERRNLLAVLSATVQPSSVLLPVVGVLLVTAEWSQRTGLVTFGLVPRRSLVLAAKLLSGATLAVVAFAVSLALAVVSEAFVGSQAPHRWGITAVQLVQAFVYVLVALLGGVAFGAAFLTTPLAITMSFVLPIGWGFVASIHALHGIRTWVDESSALSALTGHTLDAGEWAHVVTALAVWLAVPLVVGWSRVRRADIR